MKIAQALFFVSLVVLIYTFFIYPLLLRVLARWPRPTARNEKSLPMISLLIPVYNEEKVLLEKIANSLALDYPADLLEIVFVSDGSTDRSVSIIKASVDPRVHIVDYPENRGKTAVLNETIPQLRGEIVVLTDASGLLNADVLKHMIPHFHDAQVGCVCGIYHIIKEGRSRVDTAESSYHGLEMQLRSWEGQIWSTLSGTGSLCAFRKSDYQILPPDVINEDYILPARIALQGKRVIYEPRAHLYDRISTSLAQGFRRRVRIAYGNWQQIACLKALLNPARGYLAWVFYSHKLLRMAFPLILAVLVLTSWTVSRGLFFSILGAILISMALGIVALLMDRLFRGHNPLGFLVLIFFNCAAVVIGTAKFITGQKVKW